VKCANHPELEAAGICVKCGNGLCIDCKREIGGKFYCRACADADSQRRITKCVNHPELNIVGMCIECGKGLCVECKREISGKLYCQACIDAYRQIHSDAISPKATAPLFTPIITAANDTPVPAGTAGTFAPSQDNQPGLPLKWYLLAPLIALIGGVFGILGAAAHEMGYGWYIGPFVAAPIFEEIMKPCGIYFLLAKKPEALLSRRYTAFLAALSGLTFALIENALYLNVYFPEHSQSMMIWRYTVCIALHTSCSYIVGLGINQRLAAWVRRKDRFLGGNSKYFFSAMALHSSYNIFAFILEKNTHLFS
jgi:hypothetical protein